MRLLTFPTPAALAAVVNDLEGRWENRRDDLPNFVTDFGDDEVLRGLDMATKWLATRSEGAAFPLVIPLRDMPQAAADEVEISLEQITDLGAEDEDGEAIDLPTVTEDDVAAETDAEGNDRYPADWMTFVGQTGEQMHVAQALYIAAQVCRRQRDLSDGDALVRMNAVCGVIEGLRAQGGCSHMTEEELYYLTEVADLAIFG
jgi:hypothetical protein